MEAAVAFTVKVHGLGNPRVGDHRDKYSLLVYLCLPSVFQEDVGGSEAFNAVT